MTELESKNIVIVAHKFLTQPDDDLVLFLNQKKYENVLHIRHSFSDASDRCSYFTWYKDGDIYKEEKTGDYKFFSASMNKSKSPSSTSLMREVSASVRWSLTS